MNRLMIDIETANSNPDSVILSIGIHNMTTGEGIELYPNIEKQQQDGRTVGINTIKWWMEQTPEARAVWAKNGARPLSVAVDLADWLDTADEIWANGPDFDCIILADFLRTYLPDYKWPFWNNRCYRTMKNLFSDFIPAECKKNRGVAHNALDDARYQAECLRHILKGLENKQVRVN